MIPTTVATTIATTKTIMTDPIVQLGLRTALALLFLAAAAHKLRSPTRFRATLAAYEVLPHGWPRLLHAVAIAVVAAEAAIAIALLAPPLASGAAAAGAVLLLGYAAAIAVNLRRGRAIDCGCGGPGLKERVIGADLVIRNGVLVAALAAASLPVSTRATGWLDLAVAALFVVASALVFGAFETALANAARLRPLRSMRGAARVSAVAWRMP